MGIWRRARSSIMVRRSADAKVEFTRARPPANGLSAAAYVANTGLWS